MSVWPVQDAKTHLSELIEMARQKGPQLITRHGVEKAVVLSVEDYQALAGKRENFMSWLLEGPKLDELDILRDKDTGRDIDL